MNNLLFGKKIVADSYYDGKQTNRQVSYSIPIIVKDKSQVLSEIIKAIDLITSEQTFSVDISIKANKDHEFRLINIEYTVDT